MPRAPARGISATPNPGMRHRKMHIGYFIGGPMDQAKMVLEGNSYYSHVPRWTTWLPPDPDEPPRPIVCDVVMYRRYGPVAERQDDKEVYVYVQRP